MLVYPSRTWRLGSLIMTLLLGGCATQHPPVNQPVAEFGRAAASLASTYETALVNRPASLCESSRTLTLVLTEPHFDALSMAADDALRSCRQLLGEQRVRSVVARAVAAYGRQLALLAGADPSALDADLKAIGKQVKGIADEAGTPTFGPARIDALTRLASLLSEMALGTRSRRLTRRLIDDAQAPLDSLVDEMRLWTEGTVLPRLQSAIARRQDALRLTLVPASDQQTVSGALTLPGITYATRMAQLSLLTDIETLQAEQASARRFSLAAVGLMAAHRGLGDAVERVSSQAQIDALQTFIELVHDLQTATAGR
jgi:hypothetical protein